MKSQDRKSVLFIMQLPPPVHGVSVMSQLIKDSAAINAAFNCRYIDLSTAGKIEHIQKHAFRKYSKTLGIFFKVLAALLSRRYQRVYITLFPYGFAFFKDSLVILLARLFGYKPLVHLHTYGFKKSSKGAFRQRLYRYVLKNTELICLSERLVEDVELLYKGKVNILPNGIPQVNFENMYRVQEGRMNLLYLSNLIRGKGIMVLMEALAIVKKKGLDFHLRVVGGESDITYNMLSDRVKELELEERVTLVGPKFGEDKAAEFRQADIFSLPSNYDTFGLVLLEAMQFGVPCISTNINGIPDLLGKHRGVMIDEISPAALAKAIEFLVTHPAERLRMSKEGFEHFQGHFTTAHFEKEIINILNSQPSRTENRLVSTPA